ncbi:hypothetical protein LUZ61_010847 [Rhynchospora tenuis]|uniref:Transmembrane protein n=1 Tax=Rhynchospora tenuis TaxID=198213 RepID=A0AAD6EZM0_9POAL|nr:hypothetical protein LUZ61_010847 [Rhynchospora tenuis]
MAFVLVISLPFIFFAILLGFGCYYFGKARGRQELHTGIGMQVYGAPVPPPIVANQTQIKSQGPQNV